MTPQHWFRPTNRFLTPNWLIPPTLPLLQGSASPGWGFDFKGNQDVFMGEHVYIEFAMRCKLTTFDVEYSRVSGAFQDVSSNPTNGSAFEIYHGIQFYDSTTQRFF
jgi:hypothetical protein